MTGKEALFVFEKDHMISLNLMYTSTFKNG